MPTTVFTPPEYRPRFPDSARLGVAILGCGQIAQNAHLPAYAQHEVDVVGVYSRTAATTADITTRFPFVRKVYGSPEELLADPEVQIVDIATRPEDRLTWIEAAIRAGKHVLAQKPLTLDLPALVPLLEEANRRGLRIAVNQNGRWAPPWRLATLLIQNGAIGDVVGITHLHDKPMPPIAGTPFDDMPHMVIADYLMHWIDITRCWLDGKQADSVQAHDSRVPGQPLTAKNPWSASVQIACTDGASALLRVVGNVRTKNGSCPFWIHGTEGTIRGSVLLGSDRLELERDDTTVRYALDGQWFVDGFAGAMGELMCAVVEDREPYNSAAHNVASLQLMLAARTSAEHDGIVVPMHGLQL